MRVKTCHRLQSRTYIDELSISLGPRHKDSARISLAHLLPWPKTLFTWRFENLGFCLMKANVIFALESQIHKTPLQEKVDDFMTSTKPIHTRWKLQNSILLLDS